LKKPTQPKDDNSNKVPAYIVTFSDMVTLLLTFFVMLLSLAEVQDPELFNRGRDSFWKSIRYCGLGPLFGKRVKVNLGDLKVKYPISDPNNASETRGIDEQQQEIRKTFKRLRHSMTTMPSKLTAETVNFTTTNIRFAPGQSTLNQSAKNFLVKFCLDLQQNLDCETTMLYVVGLANDETMEKQQWIISARRAQAVADFIQQTLSTPSDRQVTYSETSEQSKWHIFWWGAGPRGNWAGKDSRIPGQSEILIAILKRSP
jgi:chemotaxis protein MotB